MEPVEEASFLQLPLEQESREEAPSRAGSVSVSQHRPALDAYEEYPSAPVQDILQGFE